ncbi:MAG: hypothetical protein ACYCW6_03845 [Candidatus Xenobia bacterium]
MQHVGTELSVSLILFETVLVKFGTVGLEDEGVAPTVAGCDQQQVGTSMSSNGTDRPLREDGD